MGERKNTKIRRRTFSALCCVALQSQKQSQTEYTRAQTHPRTHAPTHLKVLKNVRPHRMCACVNIVFDVLVMCELRENFERKLLWIFSIYTSDTVVFLSHLFLVCRQTIVYAVCLR